MSYCTVIPQNNLLNKIASQKRTRYKVSSNTIQQGGTQLEPTVWGKLKFAKRYGKCDGRQDSFRVKSES